MATITTILVLIAIGILLQTKLRSSENQTALRSIILNVTLPSTIFIALLSITLDTSLLMLPAGAICLNAGLLVVFYCYLSRTHVRGDTRTKRTLLLMLPSFSPGLSLFPFLLSFYGEKEVAWVSFADIGNKVFVLQFLYFLALHWHLKGRSSTGSQPNKATRALASFFLEPINLMILLALILLLLGFGLNSIPAPAVSILMMLSGITMPLTLIYIGLALRIERENFGFVLSLLTLRSGVALLISAIVIVFVPGLSTPAIAAVVLFPQSACSFWPLTHIYAINRLDAKQESRETTFNSALAVKVLALSFPFSCLMILGLCTSQTLIADPSFLIAGSFLMFALTAVLSGNRTAAQSQQGAIDTVEETEAPETVKTASIRRITMD